LNKFYWLIKIQVRFLATLLLVSAAAYVVGGRYLFNQLNEQKSDLESILSATIDRKVTLDSIEGSWASFDPVIQLNGLTIDGKRPATIEAVNFRLGLFSSLKARDVRFKSLEFLNTQFDAVQNKDSWSFAGFEMGALNFNQDAELEGDDLQRWFEGADISFVETQIQVLSKRGDTRDWRLPGFTLRYQGDDVYASGQVVQPGSLSPLMSISLHGAGVVSSKRIRSEVYLELRSVEFLDAVIQSYEWENISLSSIDATGKVWADFDGTSLIDVQGDIQASRLDWDVAGTAQQPVRNLAARFRWERLSGRPVFEFNDLAWQWGDRRCEVGNGFYHVLDSERQIYIDQLDAGCVNGMVLAADLPQGELFDRLDVSRPQGRLKSVDLRLFDKLVEAAVENKLPTEVPDDEPSEVPDEQASAPSQEKAEVSNIRQPSDKQDENALNGDAASLATSSSPDDSEPSDETETISTAAKAPFTTFTLSAELDSIALAAYESTPSLKGVDGYLFANSQGGEVLFKSDTFGLGFPTLFSSPWQTSYAQGGVSWRLEEDDVFISSSGLRLALQGSGLLYGDFSLHLNGDAHEDTISLALALQDIPFAKVTTLVPDYLVSSDIYDWLGAALVSGNVANGIYYGHGSVESDSADNSFTSSLLVNTVEGELKFDSGWPAIENLNARVELQNDALSIVSSQANIHGTPLSGLVATLPSAQEVDEPMLRATAKTQAADESLSYWMMESPVAEHLAAIGESLQINGAVNVDIDISIPFDDRDVAYEVKTRLAGNEVKHRDTELWFKDVSGVVDVSSKGGVLAKELSLRLFDRPGIVSIDSHDAKANESAFTRVRLVTKSPVESLLHHFGLAPITGLHGDLSYTALLDIFSSATQEPSLRIQSDLVGLERIWPSPYDKSKSEVELLTVDLLFAKPNIGVNIDLNSRKAGRVNTNMFFAAEGLKAVDVLIGGDGARAYEKPLSNAIKVHGVVQYADLQQWVDYIDDFSAGEQSEPSVSWGSIDLDVAAMTALGQSYSNVSLGLVPSDEGWMASVSGKEIAGTIVLPSESRTLSLDLDHLHIRTPEPVALEGEGGSSADGASPESSDTIEPEIDPSKVPAFSFSTKALVFDDQNYGAWSGVAVPEGPVLRLNKIKGSLGGVTISGQLKWSVEQGHPSTFLEMKLEGKDSEAFFKALGKTPPISSESVVANLSLVWPNHPHEFESARLSGTIDLKMTDGFLKTPDKKTGALRLLGIFNAEAIARRLKLDFSDLYKSGIGYDELLMSARINEGQLTFKEPMTISGPSSRYIIKGSSDLGKQSLALNMTVELPFSSNVPLAALMLGAPQVGGAVWLVDKLLGSPLSSMTSVDYKVTGTWSDPKMDEK